MLGANNKYIIILIKFSNLRKYIVTTFSFLFFFSNYPIILANSHLSSKTYIIFQIYFK